MGAIVDGIQELASTMRKHGYIGEVSVTLPPREWERFIREEVTLRMRLDCPPGSDIGDVLTVETGDGPATVRKGKAPSVSREG